jgi:hypothetical protein
LQRGSHEECDQRDLDGTDALLAPFERFIRDRPTVAVPSEQLRQPAERSASVLVIVVGVIVVIVVPVTVSVVTRVRILNAALVAMS